MSHVSRHAICVREILEAERRGHCFLVVRNDDRSPRRDVSRCVVLWRDWFQRGVRLRVLRRQLKRRQLRSGWPVPRLLGRRRSLVEWCDSGRFVDNHGVLPVRRPARFTRVVFIAAPTVIVQAKKKVEVATARPAVMLVAMIVVMRGRTGMWS